MHLYEVVLSDNADKWQIAETLLDDAIPFVKQEKQNPEMQAEVIATSIALALYYTHENPNQADRFFACLDYVKLASTLQKQLDIQEQMLHWLQLINLLWNQLANLYFRNGILASKQHENFSLGELYFEHAAQLFKYSNVTNQLGITLYNHALCILNINRKNCFAEAKPLFQEAANLLKQQGDTEWQARCEYHCGICLVAQQQYTRAMEHFKNALPLYSEERLRKRQATFLEQTSISLKQQQKNHLANAFSALARQTLTPTETTTQSLDSSETLISTSFTETPRLRLIVSA